VLGAQSNDEKANWRSAASDSHFTLWQVECHPFG
jgi:hypothetical protein